jgi:Methyltransferase FkbM domain
VSAGRRVKIAIKNAIGFRGVKETEILAGPARGIRMQLDFSGQTPKYLGMFEWELHHFYRQVLPSAQLVFDVGGAEGYCALLYAANSPGRIVTFEPNPSEVDLLRANIDRNPGFDGRILIKQAMVGRQNGSDSTTIDDVAKETGAPDFIKVDVDGGELDVLTGGENTLREHRPHLVVETHTHQLEQQCGSLLVEYGYRPVIKHNRRIWREERGGAPHNRWLLAAGSPSH